MEISQEILDEAINNNSLILADLKTSWCGPCKAMSPLLDQLALEYEGKANVFKIDIEQYPEIAKRYNVKAVPTLIVLKGNEVLERMTGLQNKNKLKEALDKHIVSF